MNHFSRRAHIPSRVEQENRKRHYKDLFLYLFFVAFYFRRVLFFSCNQPSTRAATPLRSYRLHPVQRSVLSARFAEYICRYKLNLQRIRSIGA